jgi:hypothetical protein
VSEAQEPQTETHSAPDPSDRFPGWMDGNVVLTGWGYRFNAWFFSLFFATGGIGCLVLVFLAVDSLHKPADSKSNTIGLIVLSILGVVTCLFLAWTCSRKVGRKTSFGSAGIQGLSISHQRSLSEKLIPKVEELKGFTPWEEVEQMEAVYVSGTEGGGSYGLRVHLNDGRKARAYIWSARQSTMSDIVSSLEEVRKTATRRSIGSSDQE